MFELKHLPELPHELIAVDEVGRSPLSGPVVVGGLRLMVHDLETLKSLGRFLRRKGVKDSKLLSHEQRAELLSRLGIPLLPFRELGKVVLKGFELSFLTWEMNHEIIDRDNILQASLNGMKEVALSLSGEDKSKTTLLIDGHMKLRWETPPPVWKEVCVVKGDVKSVLIGLAAIIAKEARDAHMRQMHVLYPQYGFETNMGYPTAFHRQAIAEHGPSPIHRKSFSKVKEFLRE